MNAKGLRTLVIGLALTAGSAIAQIENGSDTYKRLKAYIDSIPAIFAITDEPFIVFTANALALLDSDRCTSLLRVSYTSSFT